MSTSKWTKDAGGLPPVILLPSIQHTGSRFVRWKILKRYNHSQLHEPIKKARTVYYEHLNSERKAHNFLPLLPKYPIIAPLRHPRRVFKSWEKRGQSLDQCIEEWTFLIDQVDKFDPYYMPLDAENRTDYLDKINTDLGLNAQTDWQPMGSKANTRKMNPEAIYLPDTVDDFLTSIKPFTDRFWSFTMEQEDGVMFKNISSKYIDAYGYHFNPDSVIKVKEPHLIDKFRLYNTLEAVEFVESSNVQAAKEEKKETSDLEFETLKSQAIAQGLIVDGRWGPNRLKDEVTAYLNGH